LTSGKIAGCWANGSIVFISVEDNQTQCAPIQSLPKALMENQKAAESGWVPMEKLSVILFVEPGFGWVAITIFGCVYVLYAKTGFWLN
jgi:hypothetical protein